MNSALALITTALPNDNPNLNIKTHVLDPLSVIVKLSILSNKPLGTKLLIQNNVIYFQEPGPFQSLCRVVSNTNKTDLQFLFNPLNIACLHFLSKPFTDKTPRIKKLFVCAQHGLSRLMETYKQCSILTLGLRYFYALLSSHIEQTYHDNLFIKDSFTCYYTPDVCDKLHEQWSDANIKVVLDLIVFFENGQGGANVRSLETIMDSIDAKTQQTLSTLL